MSERLRILEMIDRGTITPEEGVTLLKSLDADAPPASVLGAPEAKIAPDVAAPPEAESLVPTEPVFAPEPEDLPEAAPPSSPESLPESPRMAHFRSFWRIPLIAGVIIIVLSAALMYLAYEAAGVGFWFACSLFPFTIGVFVLALAWASRSTPWLHVRVRQKPGERPQNINISFPLPVGMAGWVLPFFKDKMPKDAPDPVEMLNLLKHTKPEKPLYVEVDDKDGEHVEVYIG